MKLDYSNLLTKVAGSAGVIGVSLLFGLPSGAIEVFNHNLNISSKAQYNPNQGVLINTQNLLTNPTVKQANKKTLSIELAQSPGGVVNPRPSIFDECPYNRAACPDSGTTDPATPLPPATPPQTTPTPGTTPPGAGTETKNLVALAESNPSFSMLSRALKAAGLTDTLQGSGPYTVFAPTDEAFAKLPQDAVQDLLKPENKEVLVKILRYHVVSGQVLASDLKSGEIKSFEGGPISVKVDSSKSVMVNDANVVEPNIQASNGVIHAIDQVILPPDL
jgi:uncharacterized surface protein with fasciclin (FAS1) repeats